MRHRNKELMVTIPADKLHTLVSLAQGYTMSGGGFLDTGVINELNTVLYEAGYEEYDDPFPDSFEWRVR